MSALCAVLWLALADPGRLTEMGGRSLQIINGWSFEEDVRGLKEALDIE